MSGLLCSRRGGSSWLVGRCIAFGPKSKAIFWKPNLHADEWMEIHGLQGGGRRYVLHPMEGWLSKREREAEYHKGLEWLCMVQTPHILSRRGIPPFRRIEMVPHQTIIR